MNLDRNRWMDLVWTSLRSIPTGGTALELEARWRAHQSRDQPVAVIFGAYDAGKSSLLKRLLFEDGVPVPPEITVSGRRETFSVNEVAGATWTYRDSPGLAGGNAEHDRKALEGLDLADLLIWLLPTQLVTSDKETFDAIVTGERFGVAGEQVGGSLVAVLSRMEEAGYDPSENLAGFRKLCGDKKDEFTGLLLAVGVASPRWGIHAVSADPFQGVGNEPPDASVYAKGLGWDGTPEFRAVLTEAHRDFAVLRTLSGYRFASRTITLLTRLVEDERLAREEARATSQNELERVGLLRTSLNALRRKCAADLHRDVEDGLLSASRAGTADAADALQKRLIETVDRWSDRAYAEFDRLAASADQEAGERARSPAMERLKRLIVDMSEQEASPKKESADGKVKKHVSSLGEAFRDGFRAYASADLGMSVEEAAKRVREFNESGQAWSAFRKGKQGPTFASEELVKKASKYVKWVNVVDSVGPILAQLGPLVFDVGGEILSVIEAQKKAERRRELREALSGAAAEVEHEAMTGFDEMVAAFGAWLSQQEGAHRPAKEALDAQVAALDGYAKELADLVGQRPG